MRTVITKELLHELFFIDFDVGSMQWRNRSGNSRKRLGVEAGCVHYAGRKKERFYHYIAIAGQHFRRARLMYMAFYGRWPVPCVDHIDHDTLNDRITNLREATRQQNNQNTSVRQKTVTRGGLMGVALMPSGRFGARIGYNNKCLYLGKFDTAEQAHAAYLTKRKELFGEFA